MRKSGHQVSGSTGRGSSPASAGSPRHPDDWRLVQAAVAGDSDARGAFARRLGCVPSFVQSRNSRLGGPLDAASLEDVVQNTLIALWRKAASFMGDASIESWAYAFCVLELRDTLSRQARRPVGFEPLNEQRLTDRTVHTTMDDDVLAALQRLPSEWQRILMLKHFEGLTFDEIGTMLEISPNTAKTRHYRALHELRRTLSTWQPRELRT